MATLRLVIGNETSCDESICLWDVTSLSMPAVSIIREASQDGLGRLGLNFVGSAYEIIPMPHVSFFILFDDVFPEDTNAVKTKVLTGRPRI